MVEQIINKESILPNSKTLLLDVDNTLVNNKYLLTDNSISGELKRVQSKGWLIGLSSDSPLATLLILKNKLGLNGPIIAERGAIVGLPNNEEIMLTEVEQYFTNVRSKILDNLSDNRVPFYFGDATKIIRDNITFPNEVDNRLVLAQSQRKCGICMYGRTIGEDGLLNIDNKLTLSLVKKIREFTLDPPFELNEDFNEDYGIYILSPKAVNKRVGTICLMNRLGIDKIGMVGDSTSDIIGKDIAFQYSVGNGKPEYKIASDYVATNTYTAGVIEILKLIN